jgi:lactoylglutathione lyase
MTKRPRVEHVAIWVRDLEAMRAFYVASLGGESGARYHNPRTGLTTYFISFGDGCRIELMQRPEVEARRPEGRMAGFAHVALALGGRDAVDSAVEALRHRGARIESGPRTTGDGYYEAVILDPEGNQIELVE